MGQSLNQTQHQATVGFIYLLLLNPTTNIKSFSEPLYSCDSTKPFAGIVVCSSGLTDDDKANLYAGVESFGGRYSLTLTDQVTHLVAQWANFSASVPNPSKTSLIPEGNHFYFALEQMLESQENGYQGHSASLL